ncbi:MAG TPA: hypothetical protein VKD72_30530 [Gemmataceae bacterium]|nr:hypothetical protein [Gemmataceae bacterium]
MSSSLGLSVLESSYCSPATAAPTVHEVLRELLRTYDVNEYAASVQVDALKAR